MINDKTITQNGGDDCQLIQADTVSISGVSAKEAMDIAINVFNANILKFTDTASEIASYRAESVARKMIDELSNKNQDLLKQLSTPDVQMSLYDAQKQFVKSGDIYAEELLVELLVKKVVDIHDNSERCLRQIAIDESITAISKLTPKQLDLLSIIFMISQTMNHNINGLASFNKYLTQYFYPFTDALINDDLSFLHLEQVGCGSRLQAGNHFPIQQIFKSNYQAVFSKGFEQSEIEEIFGDLNIPKGFIIRAQHALNLFQINVMNPSSLPTLLEKHSLDNSYIEPLTVLFDKATMSENEIRDYIKETHPKLEYLIDLWANDDSNICKFQLTPVGIVLAIVNIKNKIDVDMNLSHWVK